MPCVLMVGSGRMTRKVPDPTLGATSSGSAGSVIVLSVALCVVALLRLHFQANIASLNSLSRARTSSRVSVYSFDGNPKIAFLFLARRDLPLDFLCGTFFENADAGNFSAYVHSKPGFVFDESNSRSHFFYGRQLSNSIEVRWGESSMVEAERLLLAAALEDPWISLVRNHAEVIMNDEIIFPVFKKLCKKLQKQHNCIPDENYAWTLFAMSVLEGELERRTLTYTLWNQSATKIENNWHPVTFSHPDAGPKRINEINAINHVNYESEVRTEWCCTNSSFVTCFLFARKFSRGAAMCLLSEGIVGPFKDPQFFLSVIGFTLPFAVNLWVWSLHLLPHFPWFEPICSQAAIVSLALMTLMEQASYMVQPKM